MKHFFVPDTQCKPGVPLNHLKAAMNYIVDKLPEVIILAMDWWDMASLSGYEQKGSKYFEGKSYQQDIEAGLSGMETFFHPLNRYNALRKRSKKRPYKPRIVATLGNHEDRISRLLNADPRLHGALGLQDLKLDRFGIEVHPYLKPVEISGVYYSHYFYNPNTGKPYGGRAHTRLNNIGFSFSQGHCQGLDTGIKHMANGQTIRGLIAGSFYQHEEDYKGPQGNHHWRGCIMKTEVKDGNYCLVELSLDYLMRNWL